MKKISIILAFILAMALTGCANNEQSVSGNSESSDNVSTESSVIDNTGISSTTSENASENSSNSESNSANTPEGSSESSGSSDLSEPSAPETNPDETFLIGLDGKPILRSELSMIFSNDGTDGTPEDFSIDNFSGVVCNGFVYLAEPSGICRTNYDNADVFDSEAIRFTDISEMPKKDYKRANVGDTFGGLTLIDAQINFAHGLDETEYTLGDGSVKYGSELGFPEIYFMGGMAAFEGELTMTGYVSIAAEDEYSIMTGDIIFVPSDCECTAPVMSYRFDPDAGTAHFPRINTHNDLYWENDYGYIYLGNAENTEADISDIPTDGSFVKVSVTFDNIVMTCGINMMDTFTANIVDIETI